MEDGHPGGSQATATKDTGPRFGAGSEFDTLPHYGDYVHEQSDTFDFDAQISSGVEPAVQLRDWQKCRPIELDKKSPRQTTNVHFGNPHRRPLANEWDGRLRMTVSAFFAGGSIWTGLFFASAATMLMTGLVSLDLSWMEGWSSDTQASSADAGVDPAERDAGALGLLLFLPFLMSVPILMLALPNVCAVLAVSWCVQRIRSQWVHTLAIGASVFAVTAVVLIPFSASFAESGILKLALASGLAALIARVLIGQMLVPKRTELPTVSGEAKTTR